MALKIAAVLILYLACLISVNFLHAFFLKVNVVFYSALVDIPIAIFLTLIILSRLKFYILFSKVNKILLLLLMISIGYGFAISVPTVIDRSLSIYLLEKMQQRGGSIQVSSLEHMVITEYLKEQKLIDVRLTEQIESGTIVLVGNCIKLTAKGEAIASGTRFYRRNFLPKQRLVLGGYSDDLTDPFKSSPSQVDYRCN
jgi:hypothetical protein